MSMSKYHIFSAFGFSIILIIIFLPLITSLFGIEPKTYEHVLFWMRIFLIPLGVGFVWADIRQAQKERDAQVHPPIISAGGF